MGREKVKEFAFLSARLRARSDAVVSNEDPCWAVSGRRLGTRSGTEPGTKTLCWGTRSY